MMFTISWQLTLIALLILPVSMGLIAFVVKLSQRYFKKQQEYLGKVNGHRGDVRRSRRRKGLQRRRKSIETFDKLNAELYDSAWKSQFLSGMMMPIMTFVGNLGYVLITIMGGWFAVRNMITVGDIQAFIQYVRSFTQPIAQIANIMNVFQQTAAAAEVFEFLEEEEEIPETTNPVNGVDHHGHR